MISAGFEHLQPFSFFVHYRSLLRIRIDVLDYVSEGSPFLALLLNLMYRLGT